MTDYDLAALGPRYFEHLAQSLAREVLGNNVISYGDGRDGQRDATFHGEVNQPHRNLPGNWSGYGVIQVKHFQFPTGTGSESREFARRVESELRAWKAKADIEEEKRPEIPSYLLFVTNIRLSPVSINGGRDSLHKLARSVGDTFGLIEAEFWDYRHLCTLLDSCGDIRRAYAPLITTGDVLASLLTTHHDEPSIIKMAEELSAETASNLVARQWIRLGDAGFDAPDKTDDRNSLKLAKVGTDLPADLTFPHSKTSISVSAATKIVELANEPKKPSLTSGGHIGALVIGGPGQGKSTISELIAHAYRTSTLDERSASKLGPLAHEAYSEMRTRMEIMGLHPQLRRWPIHIELAKIADEYSAPDEDDRPPFEEIIARRLSGIHQAGSVWTWLKTWPFLLLLDGLDEVSAQAQRNNLVSAVASFIASARSRDCDFFIVATTRPQGYNDEFDRAFPPIRIKLSELVPERALVYARSIVLERLGDKDPDLAGSTIARLEEAASKSETTQLFKTPLQVTIMCSIAERKRPMPSTRHELFETYYSTIYAREQLKPHLAHILSSNEDDINYLHEEVALKLHTNEEQGARTQPSLSRDDVENIARERLKNEERPPEDTARLSSLIVDAATDRIVLLVAVEGGLGYEVRSLQEYMAARSIVSGPDEDVLGRLRLLLPSANWRNTWLLAAGRAITQRSYLDAGLLGLLDSANASSIASMVTLPGADLAIDLLADNVGSNKLAFRHGLLRQALRLLSAPPSERLFALAKEIERVADDPLAFGIVAKELRDRPLDTGSSAELLLSFLSRRRGALRKLSQDLLGISHKDGDEVRPPRSTLAAVIHRAVRDEDFSDDFRRGLASVISSIRDSRISLPPKRFKPGQFPEFSTPLLALDALRHEMVALGAPFADDLATVIDLIPREGVEAKTLLASILRAEGATAARGVLLAEFPRRDSMISPRVT